MAIPFHFPFGYQDPRDEIADAVAAGANQPSLDDFQPAERAALVAASIPPTNRMGIPGILASKEERFPGGGMIAADAPAAAGASERLPLPINPAATWLKTRPGSAFLAKQQAVGDAAAAPAVAAMPASPATRALRMPNGRIVFTNRPELGGSELNYDDATREVRGRSVESAEAAPSTQPYGPGGQLMFRRQDPVGEDLRAIVRQSALTAQARGEDDGFTAPTVRTAPGPAPSFSGKEAAVSVIEGTPEQQRRLKFEDAMGAAAVARAQGDLEYEQMSPQQKADLGNPRIQAVGFLRGIFQRDFEVIDAGYEAAKKAIALPEGPEREKALGDLEAVRQSKRADKLREMLALLGENYRE